MHGAGELFKFFRCMMMVMIVVGYIVIVPVFVNYRI